MLKLWSPSPNIICFPYELSVIELSILCFLFCDSLWPLLGCLKKWINSTTIYTCTSLFWSTWKADSGWRSPPLDELLILSWKHLTNVMTKPHAVGKYFSPGSSVLWADSSHCVYLEWKTWLIHHWRPGEKVLTICNLSECDSFKHCCDLFLY